MQESDNFKPNTSIKEKIFKKFKKLLRLIFILQSVTERIPGFISAGHSFVTLCGK